MKISSRRGKRRKINTTKSIISKRIIIIVGIIIILLLISTVFALTTSLSEKIISGVKINGIDLSNKTLDDAYNTLNINLKQQISKNIMVKQGEYKTTISLEQLEVEYNIVNAVNTAYKVGRNKNILISNYEILLAKMFDKQIEENININEEELDKIVDDISLKIPNILEESSYYIEEENLIISKGKAGIKVKKDEFKYTIIQAIKQQICGSEIGEILIPIEESYPQPIDISKIKQEIYKEAQNAYYQENPFKLYKEIYGVDFNISEEDIEKILAEEKEEYIIPLKITKPEITIEDLSYGDLLPDKISKYSTRYDESNMNRSTNIKLATEKINGKILMPGEIFSYNQTVGARTIKAGYKEASVYMGGKVVDGIGGGICQVSTTLYNAVLEANLEIVTRKNHYFITSYVSASRDATVSYGTIDFKFKNTRSYPIKIECVSQNGICQVVIHGIKEENEYEVEIEDKITEVIPYETKYIENPELEKGIENQIQKGVNGYKSEAYRILKTNDTIISKTLLSKDSYNPLERIIEKGTK